MWTSALAKRMKNYFQHVCQKRIIILNKSILYFNFIFVLLLLVIKPNKNYMEDKINHSEVFDFAKKVQYSGDGIVSKKIIQRPVGNVTLFAFDQGQELSEHSAPFDALIQVLEGNAQIIIDKKPYDVSEGSSIIMPANIPHAVKAPVKFKMLLTMVKE